MAVTEAELGEVIEMELVGKVSEVACFVLPVKFSLHHQTANCLFFQIFFIL